MAWVKDLRERQAETDARMTVLAARVLALESEAAEQAEHIVMLIDPTRKRPSPGMKAINGKT